MLKYLDCYLLNKIFRYREIKQVEFKYRDTDIREKEKEVFLILKYQNKFFIYEGISYTVLLSKSTYTNCVLHI